VALTYTDKNLKTILHSWGRFRATVSEAVQPGDALNYLNTGATNAVQLADQSGSEKADCFACQEGAAGDTIWCALAIEAKSASTVGTGGVVTQVYFAASTDFLGAPLYLGEEGKPSSTEGTTFRQVIGKVLARDRIVLSAAQTSVGPIVETIAGATAVDAVRIAVTDATTGASGYARGLYISTTASGTKTASGEHNALGIDVSVTGNTPYAYIQSLYLSTSGNPTIGLVSAISIYLDNVGTAVASVHLLDLQVATPTASAPSTREAFIRCRNHGTGTPTSIFFLQANNNAKAATNFIEQDSVTVGPVAAAANVGTDYTPTYKVRCLIGSTTFYLTGVAES